MCFSSTPTETWLADVVCSIGHISSEPLANVIDIQVTPQSAWSTHTDRSSAQSISKQTAKIYTCYTLQVSLYTMDSKVGSLISLVSVYVSAYIKIERETEQTLTVCQFEIFIWNMSVVVFK